MHVRAMLEKSVEHVKIFVLHGDIKGGHRSSVAADVKPPFQSIIPVFQNCSCGMMVMPRDGKKKRVCRQAVDAGPTLYQGSHGDLDNRAVILIVDIVKQKYVCNISDCSVEKIG